jgi:hypothetical protein
MSTIQQKLDSLRPHVVGIRYVQGIQLIDAVFKDGWTIPESEVITKEKVEGSDNYYMFFSDKEGVDIDTLLDYVEGIIAINVEREKKHDLLREKVKELQKIFKDTSLTKLSRLKFSFGDEELVPSLSSMDINLDEKVDVESETVIEKQSEVKVVEPKVEPKAKRGGKLETHDLPSELTEGDCNCGPNDACPKCMDEKTLV